MPYGEADTRAKLIDPALRRRGWTEDHVRREITQPKVVLDDIGGAARKAGGGRVDYVLRYRLNPGTQPVALALIEAKAEDRTPGAGLEQAKEYRRRHNVPFVFSSNGHLFVEHDHFTGLTAPPRPLSEFPRPEDLRDRYEAGMGFSLASAEARPLITPYKSGDAQRRYYQDAAIRAVLERVARGGRRALLTLATGTGKTFIAANLLYRIAEAGQLQRALFLCDRDELRAQGADALANLFGADAQKAFRRPDGRNNAANARVHVATYQTLGIAGEADDDPTFLAEFYPPGHFSHIVVDECHRSAWGRWFEVLRRNPDAVQVGLTATPRTIERTDDPEDEAIRASNVAYFGEPIYAYDIAQGVEDGYLAACEIVRRDVFLEAKAASEVVTGLSRTDLGGKALTDQRSGRPVGLAETRAHYDAGQFDALITMPERTRAMAEDLFGLWLATGGPEQKSIVFCAGDEHAGRLADELNNLYAAWCADTGQGRAEPYAFRCTAQSGGQAMIGDLKAAERSHFVACTVDLLSTGVDVPWLRNVVFMRHMRSAITFYQMLGRGTRIHEPSGKLMFRAYDYTDATRLLGAGFLSEARTVSEPKAPPPPDDPDAPLAGGTLVVEGVTVEVRDGGRFVLMGGAGGETRVPLEEYRARIVAELRAEAADADRFRQVWIAPPRRRGLIDRLVAAGLSPRVLQEVDGLRAYDAFDVLGSAAYALTPRTRDDRAQRFRRDHAAWLGVMPPDARAAVEALAGQFALGGTEELETPDVLRVPAVARAGGLAALKKLGPPAEVLRQTRERLFAG
jgi:type I restriction enzyme, R subunit